MDSFQQFIAISRYARWLKEENRRETWYETVSRYWDWMVNKFPDLKNTPEIKDSIYNLEVMPSMRALMTAGPAADRDNTCVYNCSYLEIDSLVAFSELMYILMNGTGVGYSVESRCTDKLKPVPSSIVRDRGFTVRVEDSKEGWADSLRNLLDYLWNKGIHPTWDTSLVRPSGAKLETFGGRASGPEPLEAVFKYITNTFYNARGRKLTTLECHDICCVIAKSIIVGGVRRSAMISLSDLNDRPMAKCKSGAWWEGSGHRALANNSAVYRGKPALTEFMSEWQSLYDSHSGERGIYNRLGAQEQCDWLGRDNTIEYGLNPCAEILLRPKQFCNLTEVIIRSDDKIADVKRKIEHATILGTCQSSMTYFPFLSTEWERNVEEERLLGVSFTGIYDNPLMWGKEGLEKLSGRLGRWREHARKTNSEWADKLGINKSAAITCVKPSGTVSCLANTSSGIHPRYASHYIRRVRIDKKDPIYSFMKDAGIPVEDCVLNPESTGVFSFPLSSSTHSREAQDVSALEHLELWRVYKNHWCDHNPSITIHYTDDEFLPVGAWVLENFDDIQGISFLPRVDHVYEQAPFEEISEECYNKLSKNMPEVDCNKLREYESEDTTKGTQTLACSGGSCEVVDLVETT